MRRGIALRLPGAPRKALIAIDLAQNAKFILKTVRPLIRDGDPRIRYAAAMTAAYALAKLDVRANHEAIARLTGVMRKAAAEGLPFPASDVEFLTAQLRLDSGRSEEVLAHLRKALAVEPSFFNAAVLSVRVRLERLERRAAMPARQCMGEYGKLIADLTRLLRLQPCPRMAAHVEAYLSRQFEKPRQSPPLAAVRVYLSVIAWDTKRARRALAAFRKSGGGSICVRAVSGDLETLIKLSESQLDNG